MSGKMIVVLLAVCLVSAQAFVKRETATGGETNYLENVQKQFKDLNRQFAERLNAENIESGFIEAIDNLQKVLTDLKDKANKKE